MKKIYSFFLISIFSLFHLNFSHAFSLNKITSLPYDNSSFQQIQKTSNHFWLLGNKTLEIFNVNKSEWEEGKKINVKDCSFSPQSLFVKNESAWIGTYPARVFKTNDEDSQKMEALPPLPGTKDEKNLQKICGFYDVSIKQIISFKDKLYALTNTKVYQLNSEKKWNVIFSSKENDSYYLYHIIANSQKLYLGTNQGLYEYDGEKTFRQLAVAQYSADSFMVPVAISEDELVVNSQSNVFYQYHFKSKTWKMLLNSEEKIEHLTFHHHQLFGVSASALYVWSPTEQKWQNIIDYKNTIAKTTDSKIKNLVSTNEKLYLLSSNGIYEVLE